MNTHENLVEPQVWRQLVKEHWGKAPVLFKAVCSPKLFSQTSVLEVLRAARQKLEQGNSVNLSLYNKNNICRNAISHSVRANCGLAPLLPKPGDVALQEFLAGLSTNEGLESFALFLDRPNQLHTKTWLTMRALLTEFQRESEHQSQAVGADIFIGNYKATPFGVHKDNLHNFMFMSLGRRIMHFWPDREGEKSADESRKVSFEVEPGDLLYWPPEYWHVGESTGETAVSMNIDIWENTSSQWSKKSVIDALSASADPITELLANRSLLNKGGNEYPRNGDEPNQGAHYLQRIAKKVVAALDGPMLELSLSKAWLARISSAAMDVAVPRRTFAGISPGEHYQICDCTSLPSLSCSGKYLLACNGHVITKPDLTGWDKIRATICSGEPFTANQLAATDGSISTTDACDFLQELYECCGIRPVAGVICSPVSQ